MKAFRRLVALLSAILKLVGACCSKPDASPLVASTFGSLQVKFARKDKLVTLNQNKCIGIIPHYMMSPGDPGYSQSGLCMESHPIGQPIALSLMWIPKSSTFGE